MQETQDRLTINLNGKPCYDIVYRDDLTHLADDVSEVSKSHDIAVITDSNVAALYADEVKSLLSNDDRRVIIYSFPAGEEHKNLDTVEDCYRFLIAEHFDRGSLLIALGGGVTGDITGFVAATYMRGVDFIQIPTTLLAQADSSIGGKTGVDFEAYKNMVGAFYMPKLVYSCISVLKTLDARQFASGFAEVMKHGLIRDASFYEWLVDHIYEINGRDPQTLKEMLYASNLVKKLVVEKDPLEKGERRLLNFGHTIGHAIEKERNFDLTHGECVALGCIAASYISWKRDLLTPEEYYEVRDMFVPFGLPITVEGIDIEKVTELTHSDKKVMNGQRSFILLKKAGKAFADSTVTDEEIRNALHEILYTEDAE
ncbi:MAG: 3-dehydroquinate synthase [Lachnospiraceae bacterium]|nr:3-dehydroquinate synthase [Lachnospiraceae bacterium]